MSEKSSDPAQPLIVKDFALDADCEKVRPSGQALVLLRRVHCDRSYSWPRFVQTLMDVYAKLDKCKEYIPLSRNEFYFTTLRGRWCFLPALPFFEVRNLLPDAGAWFDIWSAWHIAAAKQGFPSAA